VVDLLKALVEMGRKEFKSAMQEKFKEQLNIKSEKKLSVRSLVKLPAINCKPNEE
jgi:flagellar assembly factor FliW